MATPKPKLSKDEQGQQDKYERQIKNEVGRVKAIDEFGTGKGGKLQDALAKAKETLKLLKESRGEDYKPDDIKEVVSKSKKPSGNSQKSK